MCAARYAQREVPEFIAGNNAQIHGPKGGVKKPPIPTHITVNNVVYNIKQQLGEGAFGELFVASAADKKCAVKVEKHKGDIPLLRHEYHMYSKMEGVPGFPRVYGFESQSDCDVLVMELLGRSYHDLFVQQANQFSLKTTLLLAMGMILRIRDMHRHGLIHRDIKPANFVAGTFTSEEEVYCLDLGLAKPYLDENGEHIQRVKKQSLVGTAEFAR
jgi:serine/threonine protein kinase